MTEAIGTAAAALPTAESLKRAAEIVILDPIFGRTSGGSSDPVPDTFPTLTNGVLRLVVAAVEVVKAANDSRLKESSKPVVNKDKSLGRLVAHVCGTNAPADDDVAEREGKRLHKHLKAADRSAVEAASAAYTAEAQSKKASGAEPLSSEAARARRTELLQATVAAANEQKVPPLHSPPTQPPPPPRPEPAPPPSREEEAERDAERDELAAQLAALEAHAQNSARPASVASCWTKRLPCAHASIRACEHLRSSSSA